MLKELTRAADRFRREGVIPALGYKPAQHPTWVVDIRGESIQLEGPYKAGAAPPFARPNRQRSGVPSRTNMKPYLLCDDARYTLGKAEAGREDVAEILHEGFVTLLRQAYGMTDLPALDRVLGCLANPIMDQIREQVGPKEIVTFRVDGEYPLSHPAVQAFWASHVKGDLSGAEEQQCGICEKRARAMRTMPREVVILRQKCQVVSFNRPAFESFGKKQTANAPICPDCTMRSVDALDYLIRSERHSYPLVDDMHAGIENQVVVCWLSDRVAIELDLHSGAQPWRASSDPEDWLLAPLKVESMGDREPQESQGDQGSFLLAQVDELVRSPWASEQPESGLSGARVHLALLSANKGRMVVRDWLDAPLLQAKTSIRRYVDAVHIIGPWGQDAKPASVMSLLLALQPYPSVPAAQSRVRKGAGFGNIARGLLRVVYLGASPPRELLTVAIRRLRNPDLFDARRPWQLAALCSTLKLALFHGEEDARSMSALDIQRKTPGYLCGRLLAVLERAQTLSVWNRNKTRLNTTIAGRYYGYAAATPAATLTHLIRIATTAYLPNVGGRLNQLMREVMAQLEEAGGFPAVLPLREQAEFALGFYHQRAQLRIAAGAREADGDESSGETAERPESPVEDAVAADDGPDGEDGRNTDIAGVNEGDTE